MMYLKEDLLAGWRQVGRDIAIRLWEGSFKCANVPMCQCANVLMKKFYWVKFSLNLNIWMKEKIYCQTSFTCAGV